MAQKCVGQTTDEKESIIKIYDYLQESYRYVAMDLKVSGLMPHDVDQIIINKYGDCKDMSVLGTLLLRSLGIEAYPALVKTRDLGKMVNQLVTFDFNHMLFLQKQALMMNIGLMQPGVPVILMMSIIHWREPKH